MLFAGLGCYVAIVFMSSNLSRDAIAPSTLAVVGRACLRTCACSARNIIEYRPAFCVWSRESREQQVGISQRLIVTGSRLPRDTKKMLKSQVEWIRCWELQTSGHSPRLRLAVSCFSENDAVPAGQGGTLSFSWAVFLASL